MQKFSSEYGYTSFIRLQPEIYGKIVRITVPTTATVSYRHLRIELYGILSGKYSSNVHTYTYTHTHVIRLQYYSVKCCQMQKWYVYTNMLFGYKNNSRALIYIYVGQYLVTISINCYYDIQILTVIILFNPLAPAPSIAAI